VSLLRRLDHVAVVIRDTDEALRYFSGTLGLRVTSSEEIRAPAVRLTYLDTGNAYLQLVEPLDSESAVAHWLEEHGEGVHHICFGVDDVLAAASGLAVGAGGDAVPGSGRGRVSSFVPGEPRHGVRIECTEFRHADDVERTPGFLA